MEYKTKQFTIPTIQGISSETMTMHLGLYEGYVKNLNGLYENITTLRNDAEKNSRAIAEMTRRIGFELAGVVNHEVYFSALEGGAKPCPATLRSVVEKQFQSFESFVEMVHTMAKDTRGIGWVLVLHDKERGILHPLWVADHELGSVSLPAILAVDMWEHAYLRDYKPAEKSFYLDAYLNAVNWDTVARRLAL